MANSPEASSNPEAEKKEREAKFLDSFVDGKSKPRKKVLPNGDTVLDFDSVKTVESKNGMECAGQDRLINKMETDGYVVLSDGMGGYKGGEEAAEIIVTTVSKQAETIQWEELSEEQSKAALNYLAETANAELAAKKAQQLDDFLQGGPRPKMNKQAGGTLVFVKIDKLGREHKITVGDSIYASAHNGKVLDLDVEETMAAASVGEHGHYDKNVASTLINVIDGKSLRMSDYNVGVRQLEPGVHRGFVTSDGLEEVYRDRSNFKMGVGTQPGNLLDVFEDAMLNAPEGQVMAQLSGANERQKHPKFDDQLGCEFSVEIHGLSSETDTSSPEARVLNPVVTKMLDELGDGLERDPTKAINVLGEKIHRLVVGAQFPGNEFELEIVSTIFPAVDALREHAASFNVDPNLIQGVFENLQSVIDKNEAYFDRKYEEVKGGATLTKEEVSDLVATGQFLELDRLLALYGPDGNNTLPPELADLDEVCDNIYNLLANPVMQAIKTTETPDVSEVGPGFASRMKARMVGGGMDKLVRAQEMLGSRRGKVALMAGFVALGVAGFAAQKFGLDLHFGGGHHAAQAGILPHEGLQEVQVGHNVPLHLPAGMEQHGDKIIYQGHEVGTIHTGVHGEFGPHEQQQLLSDMKRHGLDVQVHETLPSDGFHHAQAIKVDHREWFTGSNELNTDVSVHGNKSVISVEGMHGQSYMGSEHFDPTKVKMHALVTDENGHTFDLPIHDGKVIVDKHSDVGHMLAQHSYKKVEIAHLAHHNGETTAQMVSTDIGHDSGSLPNHPTTGHNVAVQHSYSVEVKQSPSADATQSVADIRRASPYSLPPETVEANGVLAPVVEGTALVAGTTLAGVAARAAVGRVRASRARAEAERPAPVKPEASTEVLTPADESAEKIVSNYKDLVPATISEFERQLTETLKVEMPDGVNISEMRTALQNALNKDGHMFTVEINEGGEVRLLPLDTEAESPSLTPREELTQELAGFTSGKGFDFENIDEVAADISVFMYALRSNFGKDKFVELMNSIGVEVGMLDFSLNNGEVGVMPGHEQDVLNAFRSAWEFRSTGS